MSEYSSSFLLPLFFSYGRPAHPTHIVSAQTHRDTHFCEQIWNPDPPNLGFA